MLDHQKSKRIPQKHLFLLCWLCQSLWLCVSVSRSVVSDSLRPHGLQPTRLHCPWNFPGKNTGAGCHFLLQGIFPTQGLTRISCISSRQILYCLCHLGSPDQSQSVLKGKDKEQILKAPRWWKIFTFRETIVRMMAKFSQKSWRPENTRTISLKSWKDN